MNEQTSSGVNGTETTRRNVADIIVAKHRNGPVGSICLRYDPRTTRFRDLMDEVVAPLAIGQEDELALETDEREDEAWVGEHGYMEEPGVALGRLLIFL